MNEREVAIAIRTAIENGDTEAVVALIGDEKARLHMMTPFGTWLHVAATFGQLEIIKRLVALGADVNQRGGTFGGGAINHAASRGYLQIVKYMLSCGAEMDTSEPERNPLFAAIYGGHTAIAQLLLESGIDASVKYTGEVMHEMDALGFARQWGRSEVADLLSGARKGDVSGAEGGIRRSSNLEDRK